jgi:dephospho-CoA kinase
MKPVQIGITGGIGSGKTLVCEVMEAAGIPVYYADAEAKKLLESNELAVNGVTRIIGKGAYDSEGKANRSFIASVVFADKDKLEELNTLIHPMVQKHYRDWVNSKAGKPYVGKEAAIMFESGADRDMDFIIAITAPEDIRIKRVIARDGKTETEVRKIIKQQLPASEVIKKSDFEIINDGETLVLPQLFDILEKIRTTSTAY